MRLILDIMRLYDGQRYKRCYGWKTDKRNGGLNLTSRKISKCLSNYKMPDGVYDTRRTMATDSRKVCHLQSTTNWLGGKNTVTVAYVLVVTGPNFRRS